MEEEKTGPKISNVEWGLVIGALLTIDITQIVLEWLVIGLAINPFIDIFVGMSLALYLQMRGQSLANPKRLFGILATFFGEMIPAVDELPLWCLDGFFNMAVAKSDEVLAQVPGGSLASNALNIKMTNDRMMGQVNNIQRLTPMSGDPKKIKEESNKRHAEHNAKMESSKKEQEERNKRWEENRKRQRETEERFGGHEKYNKDLTDIKYKYGTVDKKEKDLADLVYKYKDSSRN